MAHKTYQFWFLVVAAALLAGLWPLGSQAQELDSAAQAYRAIATCMGLGVADIGAVATAPLDTAVELKNALNAGGRQVVVDWPYMAQDTITVVANTFSYSLNTDFMKDSLAWKRYVIFGISRLGDEIYNVPLRPPGDFNSNVTGIVQGAHVVNRTLFIFPSAPAGDKLYVFGPGDWTAVTGSGSLLTAVPRDRLWGAVYWAAALLLNNRGDPRGQEYQAKYTQHLLARRGVQ